MSVAGRFLALLLASFAMAGCVVIDPHVVSERVHARMPEAINGHWKARAVYYSHFEMLAEDNLADALHLPGSQADEATLTYDPEHGLTIVFTRAGQPLFEPMTYTAADGLQVDGDGRLHVPHQECAKLDQKDCTVYRTLYVDRRGRLVCSRASAGAGFLGVVPVAAAAVLMSIYDKAAAAPPAASAASAAAR